MIGRDAANAWVGDTYDVATGKRAGRVPLDMLEPKDQPPPPINPEHLAWRGGSIVMGGPQEYALIVDPRQGGEVFLEPGWAYLADRLHRRARLDQGDALVYDLAHPAHEIARKHFGEPHRDGSIVDCAIASTGDHAVVFGYAPLVSLGVDADGAISAPRPLPVCAPE